MNPYRRLPGSTLWVPSTYGTVLAYYNPATCTPGTITSWADSGPNSYTQTGAAGTIVASATSFNGKPGVTYSSARSAYAGLTPPTSVTLIAAIKFISLPTYGAIASFGTAAYKPDFYFHGANPEIEFNPSVKTFTDLTVAAGGYYVVAFVYDGTANTVSAYVNGVGSSSNPTTVATSTIGTAILLGDDGGGDYGNFTLGKTAIYNGALTSGAIASATTSLRSDEGI